VVGGCLGSLLPIFACYVSRERTKLSAKMLLHVTVIYLPVVYAVMVANKIG
jgi:hypothetical protein